MRGGLALLGCALALSLASGKRGPAGYDDDVGPSTVKGSNDDDDDSSKGPPVPSPGESSSLQVGKYNLIFCDAKYDGWTLLTVFVRGD